MWLRPQSVYVSWRMTYFFSSWKFKILFSRDGDGEGDRLCEDVELVLVLTQFLEKWPISPHLKYSLSLSLLGLFDLGMYLLGEFWGDLKNSWCSDLSVSIFFIDSRISFRSLFVSLLSASKDVILDSRDGVVFWTLLLIILTSASKLSPSSNVILLTSPSVSVINFWLVIAPLRHCTASSKVFGSLSRVSKKNLGCLAMLLLTVPQFFQQILLLFQSMQTYIT